MNNKLIPLSIFSGFSSIAVALYFGLTNQTSKPISITPNHQPSITSTPTPTPTPTPKISWTEDELLTALEQATMIDKEKIDYSISDKIKHENKIFIRGAVIEKGAMDGAEFLGYIDNAGVTITFVGQGVPDCQDVNPYGYPTSWIDYCIDTSGNTVKR